MIDPEIKARIEAALGPEPRQIRWFRIVLNGREERQVCDDRSARREALCLLQYAGRFDKYFDRVLAWKWYGNERPAQFGPVEIIPYFD